MTAITPELLEYYETVLRAAEIKGSKVEVKPDELQAFVEMAKGYGTDRVVRAINNEEVRLVRLLDGPDGLNVADLRSAFAQLRRAATQHGDPRLHTPVPTLSTETAGADVTGHWLP